MEGAFPQGWDDEEETHLTPPLKEMVHFTDPSATIFKPGKTLVPGTRWGGGWGGAHKTASPSVGSQPKSTHPQ